MNEPQGKGKFAVSSGPVNRRTATPAQRAERTNHAPVVLSRLKAAQAKHRLGASLRQRLSSGAMLPGVQHKASGTLVIQAIGCTLGTTGMFLGIIQSAWPVAVLGAAMVVGLGAWMLVERRRAREKATEQVGYVVPWMEPEHLERLDALMEQLAKESSQSTVDALCQLKDTLSRCGALLSDGATQSLAAPDDSLFIREAIRRYIPDTIQACLKVPAADREIRVIDDGKTAMTLLHAQLSLLNAQLQQREARLSQLAGEALLQQQRFLAAKTQTPR